MISYFLTSNKKGAVRMNKRMLFVVVSSILAAFSAYAEVSPTYVARSQGRDGARKLVGVTDQTHLYDEGPYVNLTATVEYSRSFRNDRIARCLFGTDLCDCTTIFVQGSAITGDDRNENAWLADYFYLAPDYNSHFCIKPTIQNALVDLDLFVGMDDVAKGMYVRIHGPITWTKWNLNFEESCDVETTGSFNFGYFAPDLLHNNELLGTFGDYAQGAHPLNRSAKSFDNGAGNIIPHTGVEFLGLQFAQIDRCDHNRTGFADLRIELGWDFAQDDDYHFGLNAQIAAPTGNRTEARFAFDSVVGNRNHWEAGGGVTAHYVFWRAQAEDRHAGFYLDLSLTHMNKAKEQRTFDLCGRPNSRYMLAEKLGRPVNSLGALESATAAANPITSVAPKAEFLGVFSPVANLTTVNVEVSVNVQADLVAMFSYSGENLSLDFGYNFYGRTCEKINKPGTSIEQCCPTLCDGGKNVWALKGDAHVYGFSSATIGANGASVAIGDPIPLSATECGATIKNGTNVAVEDDSTCTGINTLQNCGVDNPEFAYVRVTDLNQQALLVHTPNLTDASDGVKTSLEPKFINCCDINFQETRGISHKIFAHVSYTWDHDTWIPYVGIGGFAEFGNNESKCNESCVTLDCTTECDDTCCDTQCCTDCIDCSLSQWGVWLKGGVNFS